MALMLPTALTALPAGVVPERFDRRHVLLMGNVALVVGLGVVLAAVPRGELGLAAIRAVVAIAGAAGLPTRRHGGYQPCEPARGRPGTRPPAGGGPLRGSP